MVHPVSRFVPDAFGSSISLTGSIFSLSSLSLPLIWKFKRNRSDRITFFYVSRIVLFQKLAPYCCTSFILIIQRTCNDTTTYLWFSFSSIERCEYLWLPAWIMRWKCVLHWSGNTNFGGFKFGNFIRYLLVISVIKKVKNRSLKQYYCWPLVGNCWQKLSLSKKRSVFYTLSAAYLAINYAEINHLNLQT